MTRVLVRTWRPTVLLSLSVLIPLLNKQKDAENKKKHHGPSSKNDKNAPPHRNGVPPQRGFEQQKNERDFNNDANPDYVLFQPRYGDVFLVFGDARTIGCHF